MRLPAPCSARGESPPPWPCSRPPPHPRPLTCELAARAAARLAGDEPRSFPDTETSFAELQDRIRAARAYVGGFEAARYDDAATRPITIKVRGADMTMPGQSYLTLYSLPQTHFHPAPTSPLQRPNGVVVGKADYMGA